MEHCNILSIHFSATDFGLVAMTEVSLLSTIVVLNTFSYWWSLLYYSFLNHKPWLFQKYFCLFLVLNSIVTSLLESFITLSCFTIYVCVKWLNCLRMVVIHLIMFLAHNDKNDWSNSEPLRNIRVKETQPERYYYYTYNSISFVTLTKPVISWTKYHNPILTFHWLVSIMMTWECHLNTMQGVTQCIDRDLEIYFQS